MRERERERESYYNFTNYLIIDQRQQKDHSTNLYSLNPVQGSRIKISLLQIMSFTANQIHCIQTGGIAQQKGDGEIGFGMERTEW